MKKWTDVKRFKINLGILLYFLFFIIIICLSLLEAFIFSILIAGVFLCLIFFIIKKYLNPIIMLEKEIIKEFDLENILDKRWKEMRNNDDNKRKI